jgi:hypothetical protein
VTDQRLRDLERDAAHGDLQARARLLLERVRVGDLTEERLRLAAYLGDEAARIAIGGAGSDVPDNLLDWLAGLRRWGRRPMAYAAFELLRAVLPILEAESGSRQFRPIVEAAEAWTRSPTWDTASVLEAPGMHEGLGAYPGRRPVGWTASRWHAYTCLVDALTAVWDVALGGEEPVGPLRDSAAAAQEIMTPEALRAAVETALLQQPDAWDDSALPAVGEGWCYFVVDAERVPLTRPLDRAEATYLRDIVIPRLRPLSTDEYLEGPAGIKHTLARWSYVLGGNDLFWCVEWRPGLLVIRIAGAEGDLSWCALPSRNPEFGGRVATTEELDAYDEDADDPQDALVFGAWNAQLEADRREEFTVATDGVQGRLRRAMAHLEALNVERQRRVGEATAAWLQRCHQSPIWRGDE